MRYIIIICSILTFVSCQCQTYNNEYIKTITIKSSGEVETLPDIATFHITVSCIDTLLSKSKKCLIEKTNQLTSKLASFEIPSDDIVTTSINMEKRFHFINRSREFEGYLTNTSVFITLKNIELLEDLYTDLLENKNLTIGKLKYNSSQIDSLQNEAYIEALKKSETLADKLLQNLPENEKEILKISNVETSSSAPYNKRVELQLESAGPSASNKTISISEGTLKTKAILFVEYQIK